MASKCFPTLRLRQVRVTSTNVCGVPVTVSSPRSEINTLTQGGAGLTSYTLTVNGQTTGAIAAASSAAVVQVALEALSNVAPGDVTVTGTPGTALTLTWAGAFVGIDVVITSTPTGGTGTVTVGTTQGGGVLVASPVNVVSSGTISLAYEEDIEEGDEFVQKNGYGEACISDRANSFYKRSMVTVVFCNVDPELFSIVLGVELITDVNGVAIGYTRREESLNTNFALEGWAGVPGVACSTSNLDYGYIVFPFVTDAKLQAVTFENGVTTFEIQAWTRSGEGWGVGPYNVYSNYATPTPAIGPLPSPFLLGDHYKKFISNAPIPTPSCGFKTS